MRNSRLGDLAHGLISKPGFRANRPLFHSKEGHAFPQLGALLQTKFSLTW